MWGVCERLAEIRHLSTVAPRAIEEAAIMGTACGSVPAALAGENDAPDTKMWWAGRPVGVILMGLSWFLRHHRDRDD
ncbi:hypothetical protein Mycsm_07031 (plasmid) [Mycobacterium sp. JS623]|nr:hypothetical protein Mycsm_07031 [Mycobacterium sp. JS623]